MSTYKKRVYFVLLFAFSFLSVFWMLSTDNSLCLDDITWMTRVSNTSYEELFRFFPSAVYNDRPIGAIFLKFLYSAFGLDYCRHHMVLIMIHLLNVMLTFICVSEIFKCKYEDKDVCFRGGIVAAGFFGIWSRTHMAVQWDAAIFDLLGTFWCLLAMLFYFFSRRQRKYRGQNVCFCLLFFYLAIRTKEMFLVFPVLLILCELWEMILERKLKCLSKVTMTSFLITIIFLSILVYLKLFSGVGITNDISNSYYQTFNPIKWIHTLLKYAILCFDLEKGGWIYARSLSGAVGLVILLVGLGIAIFRAFHNKLGLLFCYLAIGASIVIVLPMINHVHVLYLYFPSIFVGLLIAAVVCEAKRADGITLILLCLFFAATGAQSNVNTKDYWIKNAQYEMKAWRDIEDIEAPVKGANIYIKNVDGKGYTPFFYGDGAICKLLYHDESLHVEVLTEDEWEGISYEPPYVIWEYEEDRVHEIERNEERILQINTVSEYPQADGTLILGIIPSKISCALEIYVDGVSIPLVVGEEFVSVHIPGEMIEGKNQIAIKLKDGFGTLSDEYIVYVNE